MPAVCAASSASAMSMAMKHFRIQRTPGNAVLQGHAVQKLHSKEGLAILLPDLM